MLAKLWLAGVAFALAGMACTPAATTTSVTDGMPRYGGVFKNPWGESNTDFDMSYTGSSGGAVFTKEAYSTLLRLKTGADIAYGAVVIEPHLAERWEVSPDATTFTFHLRQGVKFADVPPVNGRELTSADVKFSYEYTSRTGAVAAAKLPNSTFGFMFEGLESVQTPDPYTVVVKFKDGFAPFLSYAASSDNQIMPREIYDQDGHFRDKVAGSGPFQPDFATSQKGSRWVMKKNPTYFEEGKPYLDEVHHLVIKDPATLLAAFQTKQVDYFGATADSGIRAEVMKAVPNSLEYEFLTTPRIFALNFKRPPLDNMKVRKAFSLALDRDDLIKGLGGRGEWALAMTNLVTDLFSQDEVKSFIKYDPEAAKRLLAEAGYAQGFQVELLFSGDSEDSLQLAQLLQAQLKKVGIDIVLRPLPAAEMTQRRRAKEGEIFLLAEASRVDLDGQLFLASYTGGGFNYNNISDPKADALILTQRKTVDPSKRRELLRELIRYLNESALQIATVRLSQSLFWHPYVKDFYHTADRRNQGELGKVWLDK